MRTTTLSLTLALLIGCSPAPSVGPETVARDSGAPEVMHSSGRVDFDTAAGSLSADILVHLAVEPDATEIPFLLNGALDLSAVSGDAVVGFDVAPMAPGAEWNSVTVRLEPQPQPRWIDLRFIYAGSPALEESGINQISDQWVELSVDAAWHPVVATIDREFTTTIELGLPSGWAVVSSGEAEPIADGFLLTTDILHIDIAFIAAPGLESLERDGSTVYYRGGEAATASAVLASAAECRSILDRRFGAARTLPAGRFVITDRDEGGYARKNFIALTDVTGDDEVRLTTFLCHELSHFWSSGAKPLTVDNWLNEGFAVFVAAQAARELFGDEPWERSLAEWRERGAGQPSIWTPENQQRRPFEVNYKKAPLALARLEEKLGSAAFDRLVVRYMTGPINDTPAFLAAIEAEAGTEARGWFVAVLAEDDSPASPAAPVS